MKTYIPLISFLVLAGAVVSVQAINMQENVSPTLNNKNVNTQVDQRLNQDMNQNRARVNGSTNTGVRVKTDVQTSPSLEMQQNTNMPNTNMPSKP